MPLFNVYSKCDESLSMTVSTTAPETPDETVRAEHDAISPDVLEIQPMPRMVWILGFSMFLFNLSFVMIFPFSGLYLYRYPVDMRKYRNGLCALVHTQMGVASFGKELFIFTNKKGSVWIPQKKSFVITGV